MSPRPRPPFVVEVGRGRLRLRAVACPAGDDLGVTLTGGDRPHVGCVVVARPARAASHPRRRTVTSSVIALEGHREEALARPLAERLAEVLGGTVVVAAGVHTDRLSAGGVAAYLALGTDLADALLAALSPSAGSRPSRARR